MCHSWLSLVSVKCVRNQMDKMDTPEETVGDEKHHWLTRLYLQGFTDSGDKKGKLWIHHFVEENSGEKHPNQVCFTINGNMWIDDDGTLHRFPETWRNKFE